MKAKRKAKPKQKPSPKRKRPVVVTIIGEATRRVTAKHVTAKTWRAEALRLHTMGWGFAQIATSLKKAPSTVRDAINAELEKITAGYANCIKQRREIKSAQLDVIIAGSLPYAEIGEANCSFVCIAAIDKQIKLHGLAAAEKIDVSGSMSITVDAHEELLRRLSRLNDHEVPGSTSGDAAPGEDQVRPESDDKRGS